MVPFVAFTVVTTSVGFGVGFKVLVTRLMRDEDPLDGRFST
jgi:hypothetical protein